MTEFFNRIGSITVGRTDSDRGIELKGLRFSFEIDKGNSSTPNIAKFNIYNISSESRYLFEEAGKIIICKLGWAGRGDPTSKEVLASLDKNLEICYQGQIIENGYELKKNGADTVVSIQCGTEINKLRNATFNQSYDKNTKVDSIVNDLAGGLGLNVSFIPKLDLGTFLNGFMASGNIKGMLDQILGSKDLDWSVQDDELIITEKGEPTDPTAILITPETGLIGTPTKTKEGGIKFKTLLNPKIKPQTLIKLVSSTYEGLVVPQRVKYIGDFDGGPFDCDIEAVEQGTKKEKTVTLA